MGVERNYTQKLDELRGPRLTSDLIHIARRLFETAGGDSDSGLVVPVPDHFSDTVEATRVYWRVGQENQDHEFFQVHLIGRSLSFALQHRHAIQEGFEVSGSPFVDHQKTVLVVGSQRPTLFSHDGYQDYGRRDALRERGVILPAFRRRLGHTLDNIGIHEAIPDITELEEFLHAS